MMIAEILATGDEILTGAVIDSNSAHIAQKLEEAGIEVVRHGCAGDDVAAGRAGGESGHEHGQPGDSEPRRSPAHPAARLAPSHHHRAS